MVGTAEKMPVLRAQRGILCRLGPALKTTLSGVTSGITTNQNDGFGAKFVVVWQVEKVPKRVRITLNRTNSDEYEKQISDCNRDDPGGGR